MKSSREIKLRRNAYAILGFVIGLGIGVLFSQFFDNKYMTFEVLLCGLCGAGRALRAGEKFRALPTAADVGMLNIREEMAPIDLKPEHAVPNTLKTETERRIKL